MFLGIFICVVFVVFAVLMMLRKIPALFALPLMAICISVVAGLPLVGEQGIINYVIVEGTTSLATSYVAVLISCWLSQIMFKTGVSDNMVKKAAELGGDNSLVVSILLLGVSTFLFTVLAGTGAAAMVGSIVIPILIATGIPAKDAANLFLTALGAGYCLNPANMVSTLNITGMTQEELIPCAIVIFIGCCVLMMGYLFIVLKKKRTSFAFSMDKEQDEDTSIRNIKGLRGLMAGLTPFIVVFLTFFLKWDAIATFLIGIVWIAVFTYQGKWRQHMSLLVSSFNDGFKEGAPATGLFFGIGMTLKAVSAAKTQEAIMPFMEMITPKNVVVLVIMLCVLAPLALYRGPLQIAGLGAGLLACLMSVGVYSNVFLGAMFHATNRWTSCSCPTATQVVWASNFVGLDPVSCTKKIQLPQWGITIITLIIVSFIYIRM